MASEPFARTLHVGGHTLTLRLCALRRDDGQPKFDLTWWGPKPKRMPLDFCRDLELARLRAIVEIKAELQGAV